MFESLLGAMLTILESQKSATASAVASFLF